MLDLLQARVQRRGRVSRADGDVLLEDRRAGVHPLVDEVHGDAGLGDARGESVLDRVDPGEPGKQGRVDVHRRMRARKAGVSRCMYPAQTTSRDAELLEPVGHRQVAGLSRRVALEREDGSRDPAAAARSSARAPAYVGRHRGHGELASRQRLEVRPGSRDEDAESAAHTKTTPSSPASRQPITG